MSNTTYRRVSTPAKSKRAVAPVEADLDEEEYDDYIEEADEEQPTGLFSTPARTAALIGSAALVLVLFASVIWIITSRSSPVTVLSVPPGNTSTSGAGYQVSLITKANVGDQNAAPSKGSKAPDFEWTDAVSGNPTRITGLGKPVLVNFWGTWCPPCRGEMPEMQAMYNKYRGQVEFVGVSMGPRDDLSAVKTFINLPPNGPPAFPYTWRFVHDADYSVATRYQIQAVPSSFFIGADGVIRAVQIGAMTGPMMESYIQQIK